MRNRFKELFTSLLVKIDWNLGLRETHDISLLSELNVYAQQSRNPILSEVEFFGMSQLDEDSIIQNIIGRIQSSDFEVSGSFVEFGVGDGLENNTLSLLMKGWRGIWVGNEKLNLEIPTTPEVRLKYVKDWVTLDTLKQRILPVIQEDIGLEPDLVSMDLDGNDYHFTEFLLKHGVKPKIWVQEYNANFGSEIEWVMPYNEKHSWRFTNYWGGSLKAFEKLFANYNYQLVACNYSGVNAFFVHQEYSKCFADVLGSSDSKFMPYKPWFFKTKQIRDRRTLLGVRQKS